MWTTRLLIYQEVNILKALMPVNIYLKAKAVQSLILINHNLQINNHKEN